MKSLPRSITMSKLVIVADLPATVVLVQGVGVTGSRPIVLARPDATVAQLAALGGAA